MTKRAWPDYWDGRKGGERTNLLIELWGKVSADAIATAIGQLSPPKPSRNAIIGKADRLGLKRLRPPRHVGPFPLRRASSQIGKGA